MEFLYGFLIKLFPSQEHLIDVFFLGIFIGILIGFLLWGKFDFLRVKIYKQKLKEYERFQNSTIKCSLRGGYYADIPVVIDTKINEITAVRCEYCRNKICQKKNNNNNPCRLFSIH